MTQSVEVAKLSASETIRSLVLFTWLCCCVSDAKWVRRLLSNLFRAPEKRFHSSPSVFLSSRGAAFHSSSKVLRRSPVAFQLVESTRDSASATRACFAATVAARFAALASDSAAFFASYAGRCSSIKGGICSREDRSASKFPTPLR